ERLSRTAPLLAEERRLLLVACSRARRSLLVTAVESAAGDRDLTPSRFIDELLSDTAEFGDTLPVVRRTGEVRVLALPALVAELRAVVCDPDVAEHEPERHAHAAHQLARLAAAGVRGAHPDDWYATVETSSPQPMWDEASGPVRVSPSVVEQLTTCPLRWALQRHGGDDGDNIHAIKGNVVHTLVQAVAGGVAEAEIRRALEVAWQGVDLGSDWHSRQELRRAETMLETFTAWLRASRLELTLAGVEVVVDCLLPARSEDEPAVRIAGRIDRLERDPDGRVVVVDMKTGKNPITKQAAREHPQLATYQVAVAAGMSETGEAAPEPGGGRLVYVAKPNAKEGATQRLQPPLDAADLDRWRDTIQGAAAATRGPGYLAVVNDGCRHCPVRTSCPAQDSGRQVTNG
uniref:RecB family exonuclease n=1 Tax=Aldersonia kunmingensis TaxID=408066 RepID=UPI000A7682A2